MLRRGIDYLVFHAFGFASLATLAALVLMPRPWAFDGIPVCPFRFLARLPCPGCGVTRSTWLATHGEFARSVAQHPLGPALVVLLGVWVIDVLPINRSDWKRWMAASQGWACAALLTVWLVRLAWTLSD